MAAKQLKTVGPSVKSAFLGATAVGLGIFAQAKSADAALILTLSEPGFTPVTVTDVGQGTPNLVRYTTPYGDFTTNFDFGLTDQLSTTSPYAYLQIQSFQVSNSTGAAGVQKTLTVRLQETDPFTFPGTASSLVGLNSSAGGTLTPESGGDSITFQSFATPGGAATVSPTVGPDPAVLQPGGGSVNVPLSTTYFTRTASFTLENDLVVSLAPNEVASINGSTNVFIPPAPVPEPVSIGLISGAGLLALGRRRRA